MSNSRSGTVEAFALDGKASDKIRPMRLHLVTRQVSLLLLFICTQAFSFFTRSLWVVSLVTIDMRQKCSYEKSQDSNKDVSRLYLDVPNSGQKIAITQHEMEWR